MFKLGQVPTAILLVLIISCDKTATIAQNKTSYDARGASLKIEANEALPQGVKELLAQESESESPMKFAVPYYLVEQDNIDFIVQKDLNPEIISQLSLTISGIKYYKFFVHPDSDENFSFLKSAYRYISYEQTEFEASMLKEERTMVVWSKSNIRKVPFVVKTKIDLKAKKAMNPREPAAHFHDVPEIIKMYFRRPIDGPKEKIEGQHITEVPTN